MVIIGAKGFAKEVLEVLVQQDFKESIYFFDDITRDIEETLFGYPILKSEEEVLAVFRKDNQFTLGLGNPSHRRFLAEKFELLGGSLVSIISPYARIGHFDNRIGYGVSIMTGSVITNSISIGKGSLINLNCTIGHDSLIGDFVEISPGSHVSGNCMIGDNSQLGTNCTVLPNIKVGKNVKVGAGSVITKDVPDGVTIVGVPGRII